MDLDADGLISHNLIIRRKTQLSFAGTNSLILFDNVLYFGIFAL